MQFQINKSELMQVFNDNSFMNQQLNRHVSNETDMAGIGLRTQTVGESDYGPRLAVVFRSEI